MCCGTGKTLIYSEFARSFKKIIVISPLRVSAEQNLRRIAEWLGLDKDHTLLVDCDGVRDSVAVRNFWNKRGQRLVSSTFKSADDVLQPALFDGKKILGKDVLIVVDEAHNRSEEMREWLSDKKGDAFLLWVSATPIPHEDEPVLFKYSWSDALAKNWICDYEIFLPILEKKEEEEEDDEEEEEEEDVSIGKRELLALKAQYLVIGMMRTGASRIIVYCHSKSECDEFATLFRQQCQDKMGLLENDVWMSKITDEVPSKQRAQILEEFQQNEARLSVLTSVRILDEAIDIPKCDGIFLMRVSKNKESWVRTVQRMSRANRLDPDNPHKKSNIFLWLEKREQENMPKCLEMIRMNDPEFFKKIRCISMDSYDRDDSMEELVAVEQNETTQAQSNYSVKCVSLEELKEHKLKMIIEYYKRHGRWVKTSYTQDDYQLGIFWLCIRNGHTQINDEQRRRCLELDTECFKMRIFNKVALAMSIDEKIAECIQYWQASGRTKWPPSKLKTLWNIGAFWHSVRNGSVKLTEEQKKRLLELDPECLTIKKYNDISTKLTTDEKVNILVDYIKKNNIPNVAYVREDGLRIGRLLHSIKINHIQTTEEQRKRLLDAHPDCLTRREINTDAKNLSRHEKLGLVRDYIKEHGKLPVHGYKTETGFALGTFVKSVKYGNFEIMEEERQALCDLYPTFFEIKRTNQDAKNLTTDEKFNMLLEYIRQHNKLPTRRFKTDSGFALRAFVNYIQDHRTTLTSSQQKEIEDLYPGFFFNH